jgi:hypothetical protein
MYDIVDIKDQYGDFFYFFVNYIANLHIYLRREDCSFHCSSDPFVIILYAMTYSNLRFTIPLNFYFDHYIVTNSLNSVLVSINNLAAVGHYTKF